MSTRRRRSSSRQAVEQQLTAYRRKRDFGRTAEPLGDDVNAEAAALRFVIQKHAASHLHYDFRLELDGVLKSWAVPKGPSLDPAVRRLAMQVEDHPVEYGDFEGIIPAGEYGGGTVMLWDLGTYEATRREPGEHDADRLRRDLRRGRLSIVLHGERLRGAFTLVRTSTDDGKPHWLLTKSDDDQAAPGFDVTAAVDASVATGRTMEEIAAEGDRVWRSNASSGARAARAVPGSRRAVASPVSRSSAARREPSVLTPMLATIGGHVPEGDDWVFEPKYDGVRILAFVDDGDAALVSRNGNLKSAQFPEVTDALKRLWRAHRKAFVADGEIVALTDDAPARFQELQTRTHASDPRAVATLRRTRPVAYVLFDLLLDGDRSLLAEPWHVRRKLLHRLLSAPSPDVLRLSDVLHGHPARMLEEAAARGWEGLIAKQRDAPYLPGRRSASWLKLKVEHRQEFVIGGWTEPRNSRQHIGAILLGYYDDGRLVYAGHTGGGFTRDTLLSLHRRLRSLERKTSPFTPAPRTNERPHWVRPSVVAEVKFNEWTADGKLRHPIFVGVRDDRDARSVVRERTTPAPAASRGRSRTSSRAGERA
jgi:bifunctional non-homologous end joining protein LigD